MASDSTPIGVEGKSISRSLRFEILRRDSHTCRYCGAKAPDVELQVDHVLPVALGGTNDPTNLTTACRDCNSGKGSTAPDAITLAEVDAQAELYAKAIQLAAQQRREEAVDLNTHADGFREIWDQWTYTTRDGVKRNIELPAGWENSVIKFFELGFNRFDMDQYVRVAMGKDQVPVDEKFRYMCGCLWRELGNRQELARQLIESGAV